MYLDARTEILKKLETHLVTLNEKKEKIDKIISDIENEKRIFDKFENKIDLIQDGKIHVLKLQKLFYF
jgi:polyribonucleotide nucleotidyltransferase